jgi:two-component system alkaline phosphatase synthesis response regulator PhoP
MHKKYSKILVVDDSIDVVDLLLYSLKNEGYEVEFALNGIEALRVAESFLPDLIILDIMMPEMNGIDVCKKLRENFELREIQILFLTAKDDESTEIDAFKAGANGFISKPIRPRALISRITNMLCQNLRSIEQYNNNVIKLREFVIDKNSYSVLFDNKKITLPRKAFEILSLLSENTNVFFTRKDIMNRVWGSYGNVKLRAIDVHINIIRSKINKDIITSKPKIGYVVMQE